MASFVFIKASARLSPARSAPMATTSVLSSVARRLEGKVALITGGACGIGQSTARLFARNGARVLIADIQDDKSRSLCDEIGASYVHCDVTNETDVQHAVDTAVTQYGKLDIMFNNAGIVGTPTKSILESTKPDFEQVLAANVVGSYLGTKHAARVMAPAGRGSIVITASVASVVGVKGLTAAYTCSKHAVLGLMRSAAVELGPFGLRVNCVSPYGVGTPMTEGLFGMSEDELEDKMAIHANLKGVKLKADDIAEAVLYLGSDESKYVSGLNLVVDGGYSINGTLK